MKVRATQGSSSDLPIIRITIPRGKRFYHYLAVEYEYSLCDDLQYVWGMFGIVGLLSVISNNRSLAVGCTAVLLCRLIWGAYKQNRVVKSLVNTHELL